MDIIEQCNNHTGIQDPNKPVDLWFQESFDGTIMFVVFYTQACRWQKCIGCNFHDQASKTHVTYDHLMKQIDFIFDNTDTKGINKVIFSNGGSMLDEKTFSTTALMYLIAKLNMNHKHITIISLETRIEYVDISELVILKRALNEGNSETELEIGIGFEAFNDHIRNDLFGKGLTLELFETFIKMISEFDYSIKCYFMLKPVPSISDEDAIADIRLAICYLNFMSHLHNVKINMHLNLTYVAKGTKLVQPFLDGEYIPPTLKDAANAIMIAKESDNSLFSIYLGLYDEGLAVEGGSFLRPGDEENLALLEQFNITQNFAYIEEVINS